MLWREREREILTHFDEAAVGRETGTEAVVHLAKVHLVVNKTEQGTRQLQAGGPHQERPLRSVFGRDHDDGRPALVAFGPLRARDAERSATPREVYPERREGDEQ